MAAQALAVGARGGQAAPPVARPQVDLDRQVGDHRRRRRVGEVRGQGAREHAGQHLELARERQGAEHDLARLRGREVGGAREVRVGDGQDLDAAVVGVLRAPDLDDAVAHDAPRAAAVDVAGLVAEDDHVAAPGEARGERRREVVGRVLEVVAARARPGGLGDQRRAVRGGRVRAGLVGLERQEQVVGRGVLAHDRRGGRVEEQAVARARLAADDEHPHARPRGGAHDLVGVQEVGRAHGAVDAGRGEGVAEDDDEVLAGGLRERRVGAPLAPLGQRQVAVVGDVPNGQAVAQAPGQVAPGADDLALDAHVGDEEERRPGRRLPARGHAHGDAQALDDAPVVTCRGARGEPAEVQVERQVAAGVGVGVGPQADRDLEARHLARAERVDVPAQGPARQVDLGALGVEEEHVARPERPRVEAQRQVHAAAAGGVERLAARALPGLDPRAEGARGDVLHLEHDAARLAGAHGAAEAHRPGAHGEADREGARQVALGVVAARVDEVRARTDDALVGVGGVRPHDDPRVDVGDPEAQLARERRLLPGGQAQRQAQRGRGRRDVAGQRQVDVRLVQGGRRRGQGAAVAEAQAAHDDLLARLVDAVVVGRGHLEPDQLQPVAVRVLDAVDDVDDAPGRAVGAGDDVGGPRRAAAPARAARAAAVAGAPPLAGPVGRVAAPARAAAPALAAAAVVPGPAAAAAVVVRLDEQEEVRVVARDAHDDVASRPAGGAARR
ncbi:MAG: hypothetical protein KF878_36775, partial [Planctomycetes bacterium]|nr:hypothetical protein [Planctomycetota bacterium]